MLLPAVPRADATAFACPGALFVWGPGSRSDRHRHHCVQLVLALSATLRFRQPIRGQWTEAGGVLVKPDAWHEVDARDTNVLIGFIDAESDLGGALCDRAAKDLAAIEPQTLARWRTQLGGPASLTPGVVGAWVTGTLLRDRRPVAIDHRVRRVLRILPDRLNEEHSVSLEALSKVVGLSPSRFLHLFTASVGVPLRPYVLWLRLQRGARELALGQSVADAAHAAGFADAAHFTRTFRRTLGATPRQVVHRGLAARARPTGGRNRSSA